MSANLSCSAVVTGPGFPLPTGLLSMEVTETTSAAVPVIHTSSEVSISTLLTSVSTTS